MQIAIRQGIYNSLKNNLNRLQHRFSADSRKGFGIHSPFVFDFIVNVLNEQNIYYAYENIAEIADNSDEERYLRFFYRVVNYYRFRQVLLIGNCPKIEALLRFCPSVEVDRCDAELSDKLTRHNDLIFFAPNAFINPKIEMLADTTLWFEGVCGDKKIWKTIREDEKMKISIDFFDFGIIFAKNNFQKQFYKLTF